MPETPIAVFVLIVLVLSATVVAPTPRTVDAGDAGEVATDTLDGGYAFPADPPPVRTTVPAYESQAEPGAGIGVPSVRVLSADGVDLPALRVPGGLFLVGYTRQTESGTLANDTRQRVYEAVKESPGIYIAAIVEATGIPRSTVRYHLRVLADEGLVMDEIIGGKHRYAAATENLALHAALDDGPTNDVLRAVSRFEPVSVGGLAEELDRAPSTVSHHLERLTDDGLVERERDGCRVLISLASGIDGPFESLPEGGEKESPVRASGQ